MDDRNFRLSIEPKISLIVFPVTLLTRFVHSINRGPRIRRLREAVASSNEDIENFLDVGLELNPVFCGNINHIQ